MWRWRGHGLPALEYALGTAKEMGGDPSFLGGYPTPSNLPVHFLLGVPGRRVLARCRMGSMYTYVQVPDPGKSWDNSDWGSWEWYHSREDARDRTQRLVGIIDYVREERG